MEVIPPGYGIWSASFAVSGVTRLSVVTMGFQNTGPAAPATVQVRFNTAMFSSGKLLDPATLRAIYTVVKTYVLVNNGGTFFSDTSVTPIPGTVTGGLGAAPNQAVVMQKQTANAGRQYRGRMAIPAGYISDADINEVGIIQTSKVSSMNTAAVATYANMIASGISPYLLHSTPKGGGAVPVPTPINLFEIQPLIGSSRHRLKRS